MSLEHMINDVQSSVPECLAIGIVDMHTGMLLSVRTVDSHPSEVLDLVAAATGDLFQGDNVRTIERMFRESRGVPEDGRSYFQEILVLSDNLLHVFQRCQRHQNLVVVTVCRNKVNLGMALSKTRMMLPKLEAAI
ncbi:MAG: hypothetical protein AAF928_03905 [Myxococcota bacterium]